MSTTEIPPFVAVIVTAPAEPPEPATLGPGVALALLPPTAVMAWVTVTVGAVNVMLPAAPAPPALLLLLVVETAACRLIPVPAVITRNPEPDPVFAAAVVVIVPATSPPPPAVVLVTLPSVAVRVTLPPPLVIGSCRTTSPVELVIEIVPAAPMPVPVTPDPELSSVIVPVAESVSVPPKVAVSIPSGPVTFVSATLPVPAAANDTWSPNVLAPPSDPSSVMLALLAVVVKFDVPVTVNLPELVTARALLTSRLPATVTVPRLRAEATPDTLTLPMVDWRLSAPEYFEPAVSRVTEEPLRLVAPVTATSPASVTASVVSTVRLPPIVTVPSAMALVVPVTEALAVPTVERLNEPDGPLYWLSPVSVMLAVLESVLKVDDPPTVKGVPSVMLPLAVITRLPEMSRPFGTWMALPLVKLRLRS